MQFGKLKYLSVIVHGTLFACMFKAANPEAAFIFHRVADWLEPDKEDVEC